MNSPNPKVDFYFDKANKWQLAIQKLRTIILDCGLEEALKWGCPCYIYQKNNLVLIHVFKEYCAILFFKGALLDNTEKLLIQQTENVQAARQMRFTSLEDILRLEHKIKATIYEAIEVEKSGLKVELKKPTEFKMAEEFKLKLDEMPALTTAFQALTPGRQRAYLLHFSSPKQAKTRIARVEQYIPHIIAGKGLND